MGKGSVCKTCFNRGFARDKFCPDCGSPLRPVWYEDETDVIMKTLERDNITGAGYHLRCGGIIEVVKDSFGKSVLVCRKCFLRVRLPY